MGNVIESMVNDDVEISRKIAYVLCGGDLTQTQEVSEQYLLDIEGEAFLELLKNQKTLDRIQYMLMNKKPLRNWSLNYQLSIINY